MIARAITRRLARLVGQGALGVVLLVAGMGHVTFRREEFQAQVPSWVPVDPDLVVLASGVVELALGVALLTQWRQPRRALVGGITAAFFVAVFPGNIAQFVEGNDGFGLDTDAQRALRLVFQPLLVAWALLATDAIRIGRRWWKRRRR